MVDVMVHGFVFVIKGVSVVMVLLAGYLAEKMASDQFVSQVYLKGKKPPELASMTTKMVALAVCGIFVVLATFVLAFYMGNMGSFLTLSCFVYASMDTMIFAALSIVILATIANIMTNKRYFNYELEGLRAIRAMRQVAATIMIVLLLIPYTLFVKFDFDKMSAIIASNGAKRKELLAKPVTKPAAKPAAPLPAPTPLPAPAPAPASA